MAQPTPTRQLVLVPHREVRLPPPPVLQRTRTRTCTRWTATPTPNTRRISAKEARTVGSDLPFRQSIPRRTPSVSKAKRKGRETFLFFFPYFFLSSLLFFFPFPLFFVTVLFHLFLILHHNLEHCPHFFWRTFGFLRASSISSRCNRALRVFFITCLVSAISFAFAAHAHTHTRTHTHTHS